ncbi:hypothetical protein [Paucibacter sp. Y2R2-4]|uniref:hypothetical protein n=1 Tax=Paucibacter sp. Y2R2-4 TaxID=2893553 RepID=UPI0021E3B4F7|nr:hypothetical protein [Paucibacter sp. Y2R2-4]MCV2350661.1 hypothetical protein [Paucibacter sp. Y2R2-4]
MRKLPLLWLLFFLSACHHAPESLPHSTEPQLKLFGERLVFAGAITKGSSKLFSHYVATENIATLVMASGGGDVDAAIEIAEIVFRRGINVEVQVMCMSSCANYIFPAGRTKTIAPGAIVGWHGNVTHLTYLDHLNPLRSDAQVRQVNLLTAKREAEFFRTIGIDGFICWFAKLPPYDIRGTYALSRQDMEYFGIRGIHAPENYSSTDLSPLHAAGSEGIEFVTVDRAKLNALRPAGFE